MEQVREIYQQLWSQSYNEFVKGKFESDPLIRSLDDSRRGVTLLAKFNGEVVQNVEQFLSTAESLEPDQYYYPREDFHLTMMSIITCYEGFSLNSIAVQDYIELIQACLRGVKPFNLEFKGITASPSCVMLQGFPLSEEIDELRRRLRVEFNRVELASTVDSRYSIKTAHSTIIRFKEPIGDKKRFVEFLQDHREFNFGTMQVNSLEFVFNDWYQKAEHRKALHEFRLGLE